MRIASLFVGWLLVIGAIGLRAGWLQTSGRDRFTTLWDRETERIETIAARNGRILTADGQVLAFDQPRYALAVHYRWLETPPDPVWLKSQALARLTPRERRSADRVEAAQTLVLTEREAMHNSLAVAAGMPPDELQIKFNVIQARIERIVAAVEARRNERQGESQLSHDSGEFETPAPQTLWETVRHELTTPPERRGRDPVIVAEELQYHEIIPAAPLEVIGRIESFPSQFPGVDIRLTTERVYPQGNLAAHLVGVRTSLRADELTDRGHQSGSDPLGYRVGEAIGRSGLELACDAMLHGISGLRRIVTNRQGEILRQEVIRPPTDGRDVVLSVDARLQKQAESLLDDVVLNGRWPARVGESTTPDTLSTAPPQPVGGCLVAMDVRTGEIVAAAASPRFDAQLLVSSTEAEWQSVANDPRRPFFPRVTQAALPPGSVFKMLTAIAGIESGVIDPIEPFDCQGYLERPDRERCAVYRHFGVGHGPVTLDEALAQSCNVYFFDAARRMGPQSITLWAQRFGCGVSTGCDVPGEQSGNLPQAGQRQAEDQPWYPGTTRQLAIGQASLTMTPLQVVRMMAAIANDGWLVSPHVVRDLPRSALLPDSPSAAGSIQLAGLELNRSTSNSGRPVRVVGLSPGTLAHVRRGLIQAVEHPRGTGREAQLKAMRIAGKTGTAEIGGGRPDHAWFAGFAPADVPRIAFVVVLEQGGSGGRMAAPLIREFVRGWAQLGTQMRPSTD